MTDQVAQLVDSSSNFRFLAEPGFVLAGDAALAESYVDSSPDVAMFLARRYSETLAKMLAKRASLPPKKTQHERVQALANAGVITAQVRQLFDTVRMLGNAAVHESSNDRQKALRAVEACFELGAWWYRNETGKPVTHTFDPSAIGGPASLREMLKNVEDQLTQLQDKFESTLQSRSTSHPALVIASIVVGLSTLAVAGIVWLNNRDLRSDATASASRSGGLAVHAAVDSLAAERIPLLDLQGAIAFIFEKEPHTLSANGVPPYADHDLDDAIRWARASGGVDAASTVLTITLQGRTEDAIVLTDLRIRVKQRRKPLPGYLVRVWGPGGGPVDARVMEFDLDEARPRIQMPDRRENPERPTWSFPLKVSSTDPEYFFVKVATSTCDCSWVAEIDYVLQGKAGTYVVDNNGEPFRTSGTSAVKASYTTDDGRRFTWCRAADIQGGCY